MKQYVPQHYTAEHGPVARRDCAKCVALYDFCEQSFCRGHDKKPKRSSQPAHS